jgi:hypothetical protein
VVDVGEESGAEPSPPDDGPPVDGLAEGMELVGADVRALADVETDERKLLMDDSGAPDDRGNDDTDDTDELDGKGFGWVDVKPVVGVEIAGNIVLDDSWLLPEDAGALMDAREEDPGVPDERGTKLEVWLRKDGPDDE